jgi:hypothetical protein
MSDTHRPAGGQAPETFDQEINVRAMGIFGIWLLIGTILIMILMWGLYRGLLHEEAKQDVVVSPLVDPKVQRVPPEPHLQVTPHPDLTVFKAEEARRASSYGWVDEGSGVVHVPVERAMDLLLEKGVPSRAQASIPVPVPQAATPPPAPAPAPASSEHGGHH